MNSIGVSILTNGCRSQFLSVCVQQLLANCFTRPLVIGIFDNGSKDDTPDVCRQFLASNYYGIKFRYQRSDKDLGCAYGTNRSIEMVRDCELQLHLESDFIHIPSEVSGIGKLWMRDAAEFMQKGECNYIYLRRMRSENEMAMHWFHQWRDKIIEIQGPFQHCKDFWWSNNPSIFRTKALYDCKTLPLDEKLDGPKGTDGWSKPELSTPRPTKAWLWGYGEGMFVHEG